MALLVWIYLVFRNIKDIKNRFGPKLPEIELLVVFQIRVFVSEWKYWSAKENQHLKD
jgi:hypothetical protein